MTGKKGEIVNLRQARKTRARDARRAQADANAVSFGRTKVERQTTEAERERAIRTLDAHRRSPDASGAKSPEDNTSPDDERSPDDRSPTPED